MEFRILKAEGLAIFILCIFFYFMLGGSLLYLIPFLVIPDISMVGYLVKPTLGAQVYNAVHNHVLGIALILLGVLLGQQFFILFGIALNAHIGIDRAFGFGLKLPSSFKETHLGKIKKM